MDVLELMGVLGIFAGVFAASFGTVYLKMVKMSGDISELRTKMNFVYDNLSVALDFKNNK